jgi:hypothetical protein
MMMTLLGRHSTKEVASSRARLQSSPVSPTAMPWCILIRSLAEYPCCNRDAGADSGIGRATALAFHREGAVVTISYLPEEEEE